jgi:ABC-2 type transport system ATP-binding protein
MSVPAIKTVGLSRWYGEVQGLAGLDVTIHHGVVGLLGPNGSGKSTLMRLLTGQIHASRGYVEIFGERMSPGHFKSFRVLGHAPGEDIHLENERACDFLLLLAKLGGEHGASARDRVDKALDRIGMTPKANVRLREMSKGMRQRIKVAQAILFEPPLLLLDEPLNGMDPPSRRQTLDLVREYSSTERTVLLASHVLHEVDAITDHLIMLHHGRLLAEGQLSDIRNLIEQKPRRATIRGKGLTQIAAKLLNEDRLSGLTMEGDDCLHLDTRDLPKLLLELQQVGADGQIEALETDDQKLDAVYDMLVGGSAR